MDKRQHPRFAARFHSSFTSVTVVSGGETWSICRCAAAAWNPRRPCTLEARSQYACIGCRRTPDHHRRSRREVDPRGPLRYRVHLLVPEEWARFQHTVTQLDLHPYQEKSTDETSEVA